MSIPIEDLVLETKDPEDYWAYRVRVSEQQAVLGFYKYGTIGISFQVEPQDWNVDMPFTERPERIRAWIWRNRGEDLDPATVDRAIEMIARQAQTDTGMSDEQFAKIRARLDAAYEAVHGGVTLGRVFS